MTRAWAGLDFGTSGCRLCVIDARREILHEQAVAMPASRLVDANGVEQIPADWWRAARELLGGIPAGFEIVALSVDGTSGSVLAIDAQGEPLGPALMYNDTRAVEQARLIAGEAPDDSPANALGSGLARALWLDRHHAAEGIRFVNQADWIAGMLSGRHGFSDENNALKMGYDAVRREWPKWIGALLPMARLPRVEPVGGMLGGPTATIRALPGFGADTRILLGTTDSTASALAACDGVLEPGTGISVLGSTLVVKLVTEQPLFDNRLGIYSHRCGDRWLTGGASNSGGAVLAAHFHGDEIERLGRDIDPDRPSPLDYYPLLRPGERFPINDPDLPPRITPRPDDDAAFLHALLQGIARIEARGYRLLEERTGTRLTRVLSIGGGAGNPVWTRLREHLLKVTTGASEHDQAAYGAALIAQSSN